MPKLLELFPSKSTDFSRDDLYNQGYTHGRIFGYREGQLDKRRKRKHPFDHPTEDPRARYEECMEHYHRFNLGDQNLLNGLTVQFDHGQPPSPKQRDWLRDLYNKARGWSYQYRDKRK